MISSNCPVKCKQHSLLFPDRRFQRYFVNDLVMQWNNTWEKRIDWEHLSELSCQSSITALSGWAGCCLIWSVPPWNFLVIARVMVWLLLLRSVGSGISMVAPLSTQLQSAPVCLLMAVMKLNCVGVLLTAVTSSYNKYKNHQRARRNWKNACKTTKTFPNIWTLLQTVLLLLKSCPWSKGKIWSNYVTKAFVGAKWWSC